MRSLDEASFNRGEVSHLCDSHEKHVGLKNAAGPISGPYENLMKEPEKGFFKPSEKLTRRDCEGFLSNTVGGNLEVFLEQIKQMVAESICVVH